MATRRQQRLAEAQDWLYVVIVSALALYLVIGVVMWSWMILAGVPAPGSFTTILSTIAGGLIGVLAPLGRRPSGGATERDSGAA
jgi:Na+/H+ antiporter NhaA